MKENMIQERIKYYVDNYIDFNQPKKERKLRRGGYKEYDYHDVTNVHGNCMHLMGIPDRYKEYSLSYFCETILNRGGDIKMDYFLYEKQVVYCKFLIKDELTKADYYNIALKFCKEYVEITTSSKLTTDVKTIESQFIKFLPRGWRSLNKCARTELHRALKLFGAKPAHRCVNGENYYGFTAKLKPIEEVTIADRLGFSDSLLGWGADDFPAPIGEPKSLSLGEWMQSKTMISQPTSENATSDAQLDDYLDSAFNTIDAEYEIISTTINKSKAN